MQSVKRNAKWLDSLTIRNSKEFCSQGNKLFNWKEHLSDHKIKNILNLDALWHGQLCVCGLITKSPSWTQAVLCWAVSPVVESCWGRCEGICSPLPGMLIFSPRPTKKSWSVCFLVLHKTSNFSPHSSVAVKICFCDKRHRLLKNRLFLSRPAEY